MSNDQIMYERYTYAVLDLILAFLESFSYFKCQRSLQSWGSIWEQKSVARWTNWIFETWPIIPVTCVTSMLQKVLLKTSINCNLILDSTQRVLRWPFILEWLSFSPFFTPSSSQYLSQIAKVSSGNIFKYLPNKMRLL